MLNFTTIGNNLRDQFQKAAQNATLSPAAFLGATSGLFGSSPAANGVVGPAIASMAHVARPTTAPTGSAMAPTAPTKAAVMSSPSLGPSLGSAPTTVPTTQAPRVTTPRVAGAKNGQHNAIREEEREQKRRARDFAQY